MLRKLLTENYEIDQARLAEHIYRSLEAIQEKLQEEIINKQAIIESCNNELIVLRTTMTGKEQIIENLKAEVFENQRNIEGNRQLINKLLNDLNRMQQDIEWYKRTYENRSLAGVIKDKLKHIIS